MFFSACRPCSLTSSCASSCACRCHLVPLASLLFAEALVRATQLALCVLVLQGSSSQLGEQAGPEKGLWGSEVAQGVQALHVHVLGVLHRADDLHEAKRLDEPAGQLDATQIAMSREARDASVDVAGAPVGRR